MTAPKKKPLGRGLDALISTEYVRTSGSSSISEVPLNQIKANPDQPRREFSTDALEELAGSIREIGIIQPVTLRKVSDESYQIIAGERRFRAAGIAGLETIPAYIRTADDESVMEMALIENIQREDLNSIEIALACQSLMEVHNMTQEKLSQRIGKNRATIANYVRLLRLPAEIQVALKEKRIDMGHARALLSVDDPVMQLRIFNEIIEKGLSVRMVEEKIRLLRQLGESRGKSRKNTGNVYGPLGKQLSEFFHSRVRLKCSDKGNGQITIPFKNEADLIRIMQLLDGLK